MAENLHSTGINVTIVEMANQVISPIDYEMACEVHQHLISKGINLVLETELQAINEAGNKLTVTLNNQTVDTDMVIMAIGVVPETKIVKIQKLQLILAEQSSSTIRWKHQSKIYML